VSRVAPSPFGLSVSAATAACDAKAESPLPQERGTAFISGTDLPSLRPPLPWWERPAPDPDPGAVSLGEPEASLEKRGEGVRTAGRDCHGRPSSLLPFAIPRLDRILGGGLRKAALHEIRSGESRDAASATGFAVGMLAGLLPENRAPDPLDPGIRRRP
jgi:hypothetical protein